LAELKKSLGYGTIIALSITSIMGTGVFLGHKFAAQKAGNYALFAWIILSILSIYISMIFAELSGMFTKAGGIYEFGKRTYGRFSSFMIGWTTWLVGNITACLMIVAAMDILIPMLNNLVENPSILALIEHEWFVIGLAMTIILVLNFITLLGSDDSAVLIIIFAIITIGVICTVVAFSVPHIDFSNYTDYNPEKVIASQEEPIPGSDSLPFNLLIAVMIFAALFKIMETYFGWESATFLAEETVNPEKVIPKSLIITTVLTSVIVIITAVVFLGVLNWQQLGGMVESHENPFTEISEIVFDGNATVILFVKFGIVLTLLGSAAGGIFSSPRLILSMARDKLFINSMADIHPRFQTPHKAIIFQTVAMIFVLIVGYDSYETVLDMLVPIGIIMYIAVIMAVPILRFKMPEQKRPFKTPFGVIGPVIISILLASVVFIWIMTEAAAFNMFKLQLSLLFFGVPIYLTLMFYYDPDVIVKLNDIFAYFSLAFERFLLPRRMQKNILEHLGDIKGKRVLEFGCGVGTMTQTLARSAGEFGMVYATDISYKSVKIAQNRMTRKGLTNIVFLHDIHQVNRVHHSIPDVDCIVSIGMLGYIQDINKVLREMAELVPEGGRVFFIDYVDLFKVIPNVSWLSNKDELIELFRRSGFSVRVEMRKAALWNYLMIYGIRTEQEVPYV
jgi:APA family basic amino acid/polyamine antiporter